MGKEDPKNVNWKAGEANGNPRTVDAVCGPQFLLPLRLKHSLPQLVGVWMSDSSQLNISQGTALS